MDESRHRSSKKLCLSDQLILLHISIESGYIKNILGNQTGIHILDNSDIIGVPDEVEESDCIIHQVR